jgi:molybdate transport system ATP-binding protein
VADLEPHGDRIRVRAGVGGQLSADVTPEAAADLGLMPGMLVYFVVKAAAVSIYPA